MLFLHLSGLSDNRSIHQKYNTYIVRQSEIFHKNCSWSACSDCLPCKSAFLLAYKNCFPGKTLPSPLHIRIFFLLTGSQTSSICFINIVKLISLILAARMSSIFFNPDWNVLLWLLSAGKKIFFNGIIKINSIICARLEA